jgi:ABC-type Fe3+-siderophore transport system permease subunit
MAMSSEAASSISSSLRVTLPPLAGVAADAGFLLSLIIVLIGFGPIGLWCGILLGAVSVAGLVTSAVLRVERVNARRQPPMLALAGVEVCGDRTERAA